ncbi:glycosyltransferase family 2 protein [Roseicyclus mahoneyensis]|jgi:hypothetical protein|uniref:Glycosyl transferase family 2 n=1 Tax=Roseicyclus mahoneyensis TaxID=164332 RepID=A0A316GL36_9RHOB|nr:glycosyltransferase family 2 protein [Roseicyclus mahoneyensis]PWK60918.1 glycosyl transferase family 2 [Roseicyclus mahoneyensis]
MKILVVTSLKDEGPYILEWVAYHKAIGFSDVVIFENDSSDHSDGILTRLQDLGWIEYHKNVGFSGSPQRAALKKTLALDSYKNSDWVLCADCDEFVVPKREKNIVDFLNERRHAQGIAINWLNFGSAGIEKWSPEMTIERFKMCSDNTFLENMMTKSFHRPSKIFPSFGLHRPRSSHPIDDFVFVDGTMVDARIQLGEMPDDNSKTTVRNTICSMNHYSVRSIEEYRRKEVRGDGVHDTRIYGGKQKFNRRDTNSIENLDIQRFIPKTREFLSALLQDPVLEGLYRDTCLFHFGRTS